MLRPVARVRDARRGGGSWHAAGHAVRAGENQRISFWLGEGVQVRADVGHDREGIDTVRLPASDLGEARNGWRPATSQSWRAIRTVPAVTLDVGALESGQLAP